MPQPIERVEQISVAFPHAHASRAQQSDAAMRARTHGRGGWPNAEVYDDALLAKARREQLLQVPAITRGDHANEFGGANFRRRQIIVENVVLVRRDAEWDARQPRRDVDDGRRTSHPIHVKVFDAESPRFACEGERFRKEHEVHRARANRAFCKRDVGKRAQHRRRIARELASCER
jgi:hypothetical protein